MSSARNLIACCLLLGAVVGCQRIEDPREAQMSNAPIIEDEAMALRQWEPSVARYASGSAPSYPTLYPYTASRDLPGPAAFAMNPVIFFAQTALLPITFFTTPAWQQDDTRGVQTPPTYTAVPAVQPDAQSWENFDGVGVLTPYVTR